MSNNDKSPMGAAERLAEQMLANPYAWGHTAIETVARALLDAEVRLTALEAIAEAAQRLLESTAYLEGHYGMKAGDAFDALVAALDALPDQTKGTNEVTTQ